MKKQKFISIIVVGDLTHGFKFVGPFDTIPEASAYATKNFKGENLSIQTMHNPESIPAAQMKILVKM